MSADAFRFTVLPGTGTLRLPNTCQSCFTGMRTMSPAELFQAAVSHHQRGDLEQAKHCYRQVLETDPAYPNVHCNLGVALQASGRGDEALACLRKAIALHPSQAAAHVNLGVVLQSQGQLCDAIGC